MLRLALLLIGARNIAREWPLLLALGIALFITGVSIIVDASDRHTIWSLEAFGLVMLAVGIAQFIYAVSSGWGTQVLVHSGQGTVYSIAGMLAADMPFECEIAVPTLFGTAFIVNGAFQLCSASTIKFPRWKTAFMCGLVYMILGALMFVQWRAAKFWVIPLFFGIGLTVWGWSVILLSLRLRRLAGESTHSHALRRDLAFLIDHCMHNRFVEDLKHLLSGQFPVKAPLPNLDPLPAEDLLVHVWTAAGAAGRTREGVLIERYIAAADANGKISTGHSALQLSPDVYISHYPKEEMVVDADGNFIRELRAKDIEGIFIESHAKEVADWMPPTTTLCFKCVNGKRVRSFWEIYSRDSTYNLTNRNCSVAVALALDVAMYGRMAGRFPVLMLLWLLFNRHLWVACLVRKKAEQMVWTPGLLLDYAKALHRVVEH